MMNEIVGAKISLKLAGEQFQFIYNRDKKEVYNIHFPGIKIDRVRIACGHVIPHDMLLNMVEEKAQEFELAIAREELNQAIQDFKDYSDCF